MKYKQINTALNAFWLIASIGIIIVMVLSFQVVKYFEKKVNKK